MLKKLIAAALGLFVAAAFAASVDANKATQAELEALKGVGPGIATKILDERKKGAFKDWADMVDRVKGVGEGSAAKLSAEGLTVNGAAFKATATAPSAKKDEAKAKPVVAAATPATPAVAATPAMPAKKTDAAMPAASATKAAAADEAKKATAATQSAKAAAPKASEPAKK